MFKRRKVAGLFLTVAIIISLLLPSVAFAVDPAPTSPPAMRLAGYDRYETAVEIAKAGWARSDYALLAYGENYPDALAAAPLAYKHDAPILLTRSNSLPDVTKETLSELQVKNVIIIGGTGVIYATVETELKDMGLNVSRVFGNDKYDTAVEVAKKITASASSVELFVVTGEDYPDALSVGSIAGFKQMPIILAPGNDLPDSVKNYLSTVNVSKSYVIGNSAIISDNVYSQFLNAERIPGADKYDRNIAVLQKFAGEFKADSICIATGEVFADALTGTAYSAKLGEPILLINSNPPANTKSYYQQKATQISKVFVFGGTGIIPESALQNLEGDTAADTGNEPSDNDYLPDEGDWSDEEDWLDEEGETGYDDEYGDHSDEGYFEE